MVVRESSEAHAGAKPGGSNTTTEIVDILFRIKN